MKYNIIYRNPVLGRFFHGSGFSGSDTDFGRSGSRHKKKLDPDPGKKPGSETLVIGKQVDIKENEYLAYLRKNALLIYVFFQEVFRSFKKLS